MLFQYLKDAKEDKKEADDSPRNTFSDIDWIAGFILTPEGQRGWFGPADPILYKIEAASDNDERNHNCAPTFQNPNIASRSIESVCIGLFPSEKHRI